MSSVDKLARRSIAVGRDLFRNTWVHRLPITGWLYERVFAAVDRPDVIDFRGVRVRIDPMDTTITPTLITGQYESTEFEILEALLRPGMTVLDVGANNGTYSCIASGLVGTEGRVISFEPVPANLALLNESLSLNLPGTSNVTVVEAAAGSTTETVRIYLQAGNSGTHSAGAESDTWVDAEGVRLDDVAAEQGVDRVDLLKVDVEGFEPHVLAGAADLLEAFSPVILCEFDREMVAAVDVGPADFAALLAAHGDLYLIDERRGTLQRIDGETLATARNSNVIVIPPSNTTAMLALAGFLSTGRKRQSAAI